MSSYNRILRLTSRAVTVTGLALATSAFGQDPATPPAQPAAPAHARPPRIVRPGVATPGVSRPLSDIQTEAVFPVEGSRTGR